MARINILDISSIPSILLLFTMAVANGSPVPAETSPSEEKDCRPIDLSYPYDENTIYWIGVTPFRFTKKTVNDPEQQKEGDGGLKIFYTANEFESGEHGGTHLDAPYHFYKQGWKIGDIPIERLAFVNGIVLDAKEEVESNLDYALTIDKVQEWEKKLGKPISEPTVIIINYGWAKRYPNKTEYYGSKTLKSDDLHFPGISKEAAQWMADNKMILGVGLDTPSADSGKNNLILPAHIIINGANKYIIENMALDGIDLPDGQHLKMTISPMKIREGTGAPCRIFALPAQCKKQD